MPLYEIRREAGVTLLMVSGHAADRNAPCAGAVALEPMNAPAGRPDNLGHVVGDDQRGEDVAQPLRKVRPKLPAVVVLDEAQKPSMLNAPDSHQ